MNNTILSLSLLLTGAFVVNVTAQCPFDPTISPANPILCPGGTEVLSTQVYDSYQWYKDGSPLPGANGQTHSVDAFTDGGSTFSVEATLAGCTEMSPSVLVDGWVFLLPTVMTTGSDPLFITPDAAVYCEGDTVLLVMMPPYDTNIQWTDGGVPIPGATDDTLVVMTEGEFSCSGAPGICPDFLQPLGVTIGIMFQAPVQPMISPGDVGQICADPPGMSYQWYLYGVPIPDSDSVCIATMVPGGVYTVFVTYVPDCSILSDVYIHEGLDEATDTPTWGVYPVPATDQIILSWADGSSIKGWHLLDLTGRKILLSERASISPLHIDVSGLAPGRYWFSASEGPSVPFAVVR